MLGPLEVRTDSGQIIEVAGARLRVLLIMLALHPGQLVTAGQLIDGLWLREMPAAAANALQALVSRLRRALPGAMIESRPAGYQLMLDPRSTDIVRFEDLAAAGRAQLRDDGRRPPPPCARRSPCGAARPWPRWPTPSSARPRSPGSTSCG
jgi:DNA-binding SARP family transcriptional activator